MEINNPEETSESRENPSMISQEQKSKSDIVLPIVATIVVLGIIGGGVYIYLNFVKVDFSKVAPVNDTVNELQVQNEDSGFPKVDTGDLSTEDWQEFNYGSKSSLPPYNFSFIYPANFTQGVDIASIILLPEKYRGLGYGVDKPEFIISSFPMFEKTKEDFIRDIEKEGALTGKTRMIAGYKALELHDPDRSDVHIWFFTSEPDEYTFDFSTGLESLTDEEKRALGDLTTSPVYVYIFSTLERDPEFAGIEDKIIDSLEI